MNATETNDFPPDEVRSAPAIARRALALFGVVGLELGAPREDIVAWLKDEGLWDELSPIEVSYVSAHHPTEKQRINASWWSEALIVLLWSIKKVEALPSPNEQCNTSLFQELLPPFANVATAELISSATRRSEDELLDMADTLLDLHWKARDAKIHSRDCPSVDIEIIQERHRAINWIIGYDGLPWDEVTTDT
jgi:hypothetical protein